MSRALYISCLLTALTAHIASAQTINVTAPANGANTVAAANDYATTVLQDPWDMNQRTDFGGWLSGLDTRMPAAGPR